MAKRGQVQQLQQEINNDEELLLFINRDGLILLDVYPEWCGPCTGMIGTLRKMKLEQGGDDLHLGIAKSDNIKKFERFKNKSEPTWVFISKGKICNVTFGPSVPIIMSVIIKELERERAAKAGNETRTFYNLDEMTPLELERYNAIQSVINEKIKLAREEREFKRTSYLTYVTNTVMENLPHVGVTFFMPHLMDHTLFRRVSEFAERCEIVPRDRKTIRILPEHMEVINFECANPLDTDLLDYLFEKDIFAIAWELENPSKNIEQILEYYQSLLTVPQPLLDEYGNPDPEEKVPAVVRSAEVILEIPVSDIEEENEEEAEHEVSGDLSSADPNIAVIPTVVEEKLPEPIEELHENYNDDEIRDDRPRLRIPAMWTPTNHRCNAALVYLYFRSMTDTWLPPDPVEEPPHLAISFDISKDKNVMQAMADHEKALLAYGYFNSDDPDKAEFIANSPKRYARQANKSPNDKLVIKIAKVTSHALLALTSEGPNYVSPDCEIGKEECLKFFPEGYENPSAEMELEEEKLLEAAFSGRKSGKRRSRKSTMKSIDLDEAAEGDTVACPITLPPDECISEDEGEDEGFYAEEDMNYDA